MQRTKAYMYDWSSIVTSGYPLRGMPLSWQWYLPHEQNNFPVRIFALLDYDEEGFLRGCCMYFPDGGPTELPGNVTTIIRKNERRNGHATRLLTMVMNQFPEIDLSKQVYSDDGWAFIQGFANFVTEEKEK